MFVSAGATIAIRNTILVIFNCVLNESRRTAMASHLPDCAILLCVRIPVGIIFRNILIKRIDKLNKFPRDLFTCAIVGNNKRRVLCLAYQKHSHTNRQSSGRKNENGNNVDFMWPNFHRFIW